MARLATLFDELEKPDLVQEASPADVGGGNLASLFQESSPRAVATPTPVQAAPTYTPEGTRRQQVLQKQQANLSKVQEDSTAGDLAAAARSSVHAIDADRDLGGGVFKSMFTGAGESLDNQLSFSKAIKDFDAQVRSTAEGPLDGSLTPDTVSFLAQQGRQWQKSGDGALIGAGVGAIAGPLGAVGGAKLGFNIENARNWYMSSVGSLYTRFKETGIDDKVARYGAIAAGIPYAAIEFLSGYMPGIKGLVGIKAVANAHLGKFALSAGKSWLAKGAAEASEESVQQWLEEGAVSFLSWVSDTFAGTDTEGVELQEGLQAGIDAFTQSFLPILLGGTGFAAAEMSGPFKQSLDLRSEQQGDQATTVNTDAPSRLSAASQEQIVAHETLEQQALRDTAVQEDMRKEQAGEFSNENASFLSVEGESPVVDIDTVELDEAQRDRAKFNRVLGETLFGKPIIFVNSKKINGLFTNDAIYITPESGIETLFHEEGHGISRWAMQQDVHKQTITDTIDFFKAKEEYWSTFRTAMKKQGVTLEELDEETVAMTFAQILSNQEAVTEMLETNPTLFKRIVALVQDFFSSVGSITADLVGKAPAEFANPDITAGGREGMDAFSDASLREVFGKDYDVMRKRLLETTKAFIKSTKEASPESTAVAEEFIAAVEGAEEPVETPVTEPVVEPTTEPVAVTEPEIEAAPTDSADSAALSRKITEEDPERTVTLFRGEHGAVAGDAQRSAHYEWWTTSQKYAESYSGGRFIEVTPEGDKRRSAEGARIRRENIKVGNVLNLMGQTIYTKASFIAKLKAEGIDIDPNDVPDSKGRAVEFFKQDTRTGKLGDAIAAAGYDSVAQTESKNTPVVIVFKKEAKPLVSFKDESTQIEELEASLEEIIGGSDVSLIPSINTGEISIARLAVPKGVRGQGLGRKAIDELKAFATKNSLGLSVAPRSDLVVFYKKMGFTDDGQGAMQWRPDNYNKNAFRTDTPAAARKPLPVLKDREVTVSLNGTIKFKQPIHLKNGGRLWGFTDDTQTTFWGRDTSKGRFTITVEKASGQIDVGAATNDKAKQFAETMAERIVVTDTPAAARTPQEERRDDLKRIIRDFHKAQLPKDQEQKVEDRAQASLDKILEFGKAQVDSIRRGLGARAGRLAQAYLDDNKAEAPALSRAPKQFEKDLKADIRKTMVTSILKRLKTLGVVNDKFKQSAEAIPDSVIRAIHEVVAKGNVALVKSDEWVGKVIDRSIELKYIPKVFKREVTQIRKGEEQKEERKVKRAEARTERERVAKLQKHTRGDQITLTEKKGEAGNKRVIVYVRETDDHWIGIAGEKYSKKVFAAAEETPDTLFVARSLGGGNKSELGQIPLTNVQQSADGRSILGTVTKTVNNKAFRRSKKQPNGKFKPLPGYKKGERISFKADDGWFLVDEEVEFHERTDADAVWEYKRVFNRRANEFFLRRHAAGRTFDVDIGTLERRLQIGVDKIAHDISLGKFPKGQGHLAGMRIEALADEAQKVSDERKPDIFTKGETIDSIPEMSLRYRLAVSTQIDSLRISIIKSMVRDAADVQSLDQKSLKGGTLKDVIAARDIQLDRSLNEDAGAAVDPAVTQEPSVTVPIKERKSRPPSNEHQGLLDKFQRDGLISKIGGKWTMGDGGLEAIRDQVEDEVGGNEKIAAIVNERVRAALESVGLIDIPLASRRPIRVPEVNAQAQQRGYAGYEAVSKLGAERLIVEAKKLLREGITHDKALFTDLVLNAMADKFTDDSLKTPIKNPRAGVQTMKRLGEAYLGFKSASAGTVSIGKADMGSTDTIWFERWRDSIGMGSGAFQLETLQSFVKNKGGFGDFASRKAMSPIHRELTRVRAEEMSKRLKKMLGDKYKEKFGTTQKGRKAAEDAWASIVSEIGRPQDNLEALAHVGSEYIQKLQTIMEFHMASKSDKALEWWKSAGLLSGISTILQNPISNAVRQMYEYGPKKIVVDTLQGKSPVTTIGEMMTTQRMWGQFSKNAWRVAVQSFKNEYPLIRWGDHGSKLDPGTVRHAIRGPLGRIIRLPYRMLEGGDEYFKMLDIQMNFAQHYYGSVSTGIDPISGEKITARQPSLKEIEEWIMGKDVDGVHIGGVIENGHTAQDGLYAAAVHRALENTWQNENRFAKPFSTARSAIPGHAGEFIMPFVNTPMNIFTQSLRMSPLGIVNLGRKAIQNKINRLNNKEVTKYVDFKNDTFARDVGEQVIAWGALMALLPYVRDDDDDEEKRPSITGSNPSFRLEPGRGSFMRQETMPPLNIRIGDKMFDYSRIEPIATVLPIIIDNLRTYQKIQKGEKAGKALAEAYAALGVAATDKTFLGSIHDLVLAIENPDNVGRFASNFIASWVPNIVRQTMRLTDPYARDLMPKGERFSKEWLVSFAKNTGYTMVPAPAIARDLLPPPRYDYWGQPVSKTNAQQPSSDFVYRLASLSGVKVKQDKGQNLNMMIHNWNQRERFAIDSRSERLKNPRIFGAKYFFRPARYLEVGKGRDGKAINHYMTNEEYQEYVRTSGSIALEQAEKVTFNYEHPSIRDINRLSSIMEMARRIARNRIKKKIRRQS